MDRLLLLDSNSLLNRAYYAINRGLNAPDGRPTNAVYGFLSMLVKLLNNYKPTNIIAAFDVKAPTFRKEMYARYKAQRKPMDEELAVQLPMLKDLLRSMDIQVIESPGFEADDIIGTLSVKCPFDTLIVTGDKDSLQLISDTTTVLLTKTGITDIVEYTPERLLEDGLVPSQIIDLKALMGDASDNIPGVPGVGEKTAKRLLSDFKTLDNVYEHIDEINGKLRDKLSENKELAYLSYSLATIKSDMDIEYDNDKSRLNYPFNTKASEFMNSLGFRSIIDRLEFKGETKAKSDCEKIEIKTSGALQALLGEINKIGRCAILTEKGVQIAVDTDKTYIINVRETLIDDGMDMSEIESALTELLKNDSLAKLLYDAKSLMHKYGEFVNFDDLAIKAYLADSNRNYKNFEALASDKNTESNACNMLQIEKALDYDMAALEIADLYSNIELPLIRVLYGMEKSGITVDPDVLYELRQRFGDELRAITDEIYALVGRNDFNINSPKQLSGVLFEELGLRRGRKSKTGAYSTNIEVLESLKLEHPVVPLILKYREVSKLLGTYINGIIPLPDDGKLHSIFNQTVTATGRLSSTEPNLQNIPIRKAIGREIRRMFRAGKDSVLLSADYSQIELRLLAHLSGDGNLINAFIKGEDIHRETASKVFGVSIDEVTPEMRRRAKAVNFGIIYGISDYGLSEDVGCSVNEAKLFIAKYFETYPFVKNFLDGAIQFAREKGFQRTICNRIRKLPDINSKNYQIRSFNERVAMNMPMQGSASDIIKIAMVNVDEAFDKRKLKAKLILQVHDELIVDCPKGEKEIVKSLLKDCMENAVSLNVPLVVDIGEGETWFDAK